MSQASGALTLGSFGGVNLFTSPISVAGPTTSNYIIAGARGFTKWSFTLAGTFTGFSVAIFATLDQAVLKANTAFNPTDGVTPNTSYPRSEERRVGKECRSRWSP